MRTDRFADVDLRTLPANPSPPDMWQDRAACFASGMDEFVSKPFRVEDVDGALRRLGL